MSAVDAARALRDALTPLVGPIGSATVALNAIDHAWAPHARYAERFAPAGHRVEALWLGMNPGPWGMAQTGVPFGCVPKVRDFLGIEAPVLSPPGAHPKRPIQGFACERVEVSGDRLWGMVHDTFGAPEPFFERFFVASYCPVIWYAGSGANVPADKLPASALHEMFAACDLHLVRLVDALRPRTVIGVGAWAEDRARRALAPRHSNVAVGRVLHPSPASPQANRGWAAAAHAALSALGHPLDR